MGEREALVVLFSSEVEVVEAELSFSSVAFWAWVVEEPHVEVVVVLFASTLFLLSFWYLLELQL